MQSNSALPNFIKNETIQKMRNEIYSLLVVRGFKLPNLFKILNLQEHRSLIDDIVLSNLLGNFIVWLIISIWDNNTW
jgi:hypothetical protein